MMDQSSSGQGSESGLRDDGSHGVPHVIEPETFNTSIQDASSMTHVGGLSPNRPSLLVGVPGFGGDAGTLTNESNNDFGRQQSGNEAKTGNQGQEEITDNLNLYEDVQNHNMHFHNQHNHDPDPPQPPFRVRTDASTRNPKTALKEFYDQCEPRVTLRKTDYECWMDVSDGHHNPSFTCILICPRSGELFLSGYLLDGSEFDEKNGLLWYKSKDKSQFAASARALDCFHFRNANNNEEAFCGNVPYSADQSTVTLQSLRDVHGVPRRILDSVSLKQDRARRVSL
mmetsp:Transcript_9740/g.17160  ORF Transcript_9740/g.17160 Transcript_9740/m.17160 type:complete len:284 (+) Transcript_9740:2314-3165(+)